MRVFSRKLRAKLQVVELYIQQKHGYFQIVLNTMYTGLDLVVLWSYMNLLTSNSLERESQKNH